MVAAVGRSLRSQRAVFRPGPLEVHVLSITRPALIAGFAGLCVPIAPMQVRADDSRQGVVVTPEKLAQHAAWCTQCNHGAGLPAYDVRVDDAFCHAVAAAAAAAAAAKADASAGVLRATIPMLAVDFD